MSALFILFCLFFLISLYFLPSIVCLSRGATNFLSVFIVNLLFGWTLIGWVVALNIACVSQTKNSIKIEKETLRRIRYER